MKRNRLSLIVSVLIIVLIVIIVIPRINFTDPNTTFKEEVIDKIGDKEVSALKLAQDSNDKEFKLHNKDEINQVLNTLSPIELTKLNHSKEFTPETYSVLISVQGKITYYITLYSNNEMQIVDFKNDSSHLYQIQKDVDLDNFKGYMNNK